MRLSQHAEFHSQAGIDRLHGLLLLGLEDKRHVGVATEFLQSGSRRAQAAGKRGHGSGGVADFERRQGASDFGLDGREERGGAGRGVTLESAIYPGYARVDSIEEALLLSGRVDRARQALVVGD